MVVHSCSALVIDELDPRATAMNILATKARKWLSNSEPHGKDGQSLVEYSLILALIIIACVTAVSATGVAVRDNLWGMMTQLPF